MIETICQIWILALGGAAIWLVGRKEKWGRWGFVVGAVSQPAFLYTTFVHDQWGMFILALWYTYSWLQGIYYNWLDEEVL